MATCNGAKFIRRQIDSVLGQLSPEDELVVSDDASTDATVDMIRTYRDPRITLYRNQGPRNVVRNFENALGHSRGERIFLCDQDDIWEGRKLSVMKLFLARAEMAVCDCSWIDEEERTVRDSFFKDQDMRPGVWRTLWRNRYMGCCMGFRRSLMARALPFPRSVAMHDWWFGLIAEANKGVAVIPECLVHYRVHDSNLTASKGGSPRPWRIRLSDRLRIGLALASRLHSLKSSLG